MPAIREIALDTETTGLNPKYGHRIVEIGCVEMIDQKRTGAVFHAYINPQRDVPMEAFNVHGLSTEYLKKMPIFDAVVDDFLAFIGSDTLVIHNAPFDMRFLNYELVRIKKPALQDSRVVDTLLMAKRKFPGAKASLDALCHRFAVDLSRRSKHGALLDSELLADVYFELKGGGQTMLNVQAQPAIQSASQSKADYSERASQSRILTSEQMRAHKQAIDTIKDPIWCVVGEA